MTAKKVKPKKQRRNATQPVLVTPAVHKKLKLAAAEQNVTIGELINGFLTAKK